MKKTFTWGSEILSAASWNILDLQSFINVICLIIVSSLATGGLKLACECQDSANWRLKVLISIVTPLQREKRKDNH